MTPAAELAALQSIAAGDTVPLAMWTALHSAGLVESERATWRTLPDIPTEGKLTARGRARLAELGGQNPMQKVR